MATEPLPGDEDSKRRRPEQFPAVVLQHRGPLGFGHRREIAAAPLLLFDQPACPGRGVEKQHLPGVRAGAFPGMPDATWHERTGTGAADRDVITDQEGDLATQDI